MSLLTQAARSLDDGDTAGALDKLMSAQNQIAAQGGKKIPAAAADQLIADIQAVIDSLG